MIHRIVAATDGSKIGGRAVDCAVELAVSLGATLSIVHVVIDGNPADGLRQFAEFEHLVEAGPIESPEPREAISTAYWEGLLPKETEMTRSEGLNYAAGANTLRRAIDRARAGGVGDVRGELLEGEPAEAIVSHAISTGADMIVLGSRGLGAIRGTLQGSTSQRVVRRAPCTVVVVR